MRSIDMVKPHFDTDEPDRRFFIVTLPIHPDFIPNEGGTIGGTIGGAITKTELHIELDKY